jgi:hypothetical protein
MTIINFNKKTKNSVIKEETLLRVYSILTDAGFSSQTTYNLFKLKYCRLYLRSGSTKSVNMKLKLSRFKFKSGNNLGILNGFYRAV